MFHASLAATADMVVLPGVLGCRALRRTVQVNLGPTTLRLPGGKPICFRARCAPLSPASGFPVSGSRDSNS